MSRLWKDFRTNFMYWRFRNITRNRLRLRNWWQHRRSARLMLRRAPAYSYPRGRGTAAFVYRGSTRRTWTAFLAMVVLLTLISYAGGRGAFPAGLVPIVGSLVVVGCLYWALRGV